MLPHIRSYQKEQKRSNVASSMEMPRIRQPQPTTDYIATHYRDIFRAPTFESPSSVYQQEIQPRSPYRH